MRLIATDVARSVIGVSGRVQSWLGYRLAVLCMMRYVPRYFRFYVRRQVCT